MTTQPTPFSCTDDQGRFNADVFTPIGFLRIKLQDAQDRVDELLELGPFEILLQDLPPLIAAEALVAHISDLIKEETEAQRAREAAAKAEALRKHQELLTFNI